jgi:hypothetical protein
MLINDDEPFTMFSLNIICPLLYVVCGTLSVGVEGYAQVEGNVEGKMDLWP